MGRLRVAFDLLRSDPLALIRYIFHLFYSRINSFLLFQTQWFPRWWNERYIGSTPGGFVVDVGCNWGRMATLQRHLGREAVGVDLQSFDRWRELDGEFTVGDCQTLPIRSGVADVCVSLLSLGYMPDDEGALREMNRVLAPGGRIAIAVANRENLYSRRTGRFLEEDHVHEYSVDEIQAKVEEAGFTVEEIWTEKIYFPYLMPTLNTVVPNSLLILLSFMLPAEYRGVIYVKARKPET